MQARLFIGNLGWNVTESDLAQLAAVHGIKSEHVTKADDLMPAVERAIEAGGVRVVIVPTDRVENVARHRQAWEAVSIPGGLPPR